HEIDLAPFLLERVKGGVDRGRLGDVAMAEQKTAEFIGERLDPFLHRVALPSQSDLRGRRAAGLSHSPPHRAVGGDAENDDALTLHQTQILPHPRTHRAQIRFWRYTSPPPWYSPNRAVTQAVYRKPQCLE